MANHATDYNDPLYRYSLKEIRNMSHEKFGDLLDEHNGAGITEQWYFTHLKALKNLHIKIRPRFFGNEHIHALEKLALTLPC